MDDETFEKIQKGIIDAMDDIADAFIDSGRQPSDKVIDGLSDVLDKSGNTTRRIFADRAKARGSSFMKDYLRADDPS